MLKKVRNSIKYSDFYGKFMYKYDKIRDSIKKFIYFTLGICYLNYFLKHINPLFILQSEEKESGFYPNARNFISFVFSVMVTGLAVNYVLYALLTTPNVNLIKITGFGLAWWLIQKQILKKGFDYYVEKMKSLKR